MDGGDSHERSQNTGEKISVRTENSGTGHLLSVVFAVVS